MKDEHVLQALQTEFGRVQGKAAATDSAFFTFLSYGVTPFFAFLAVALADKKYNIFFAGLPVLSVTGVAVVFMLGAHYRYASGYCNYLQRRMNVLLGRPVIQDQQYSAATYGPSSAVAVSYA